MFKQLAKESVVYGLARILVAVLGFATLPFYTRIFSIEDYGTIAIITTLSTMLPILYGLSLETGYTRYFNDPAYTPDMILEILLKFQVVYGAIVVLLLFVIGHLWVVSWIHEELWPVLSLILVGSLLAQFVTVFQTVARMRHAVFEFTVISLCSSGIGALLSVSLVYWRPTVMSYFLGAVFGNLFAMVLGFRLLELPLTSFWKVPINQIRPLLKFSLPLLPASAASFLNSSLDRWTLAYYLSNEEVAVYSVGMKMATIISMGTSILMFAFMPHSMKLIQLEQSRADDSLEVSLRYFSVLACGGAILLQAVTPLLIGTLVPSEYSESTVVVGVLALGTVFFSYTYFSVLGSWKAGYSSDYSFSIFGGLCVNAALNFLLIPIFDIVGAAIATSTGMLVTCLVSFYLSNRRHVFRYSFGRLTVTNMISITSILAIILINRFGWGYVTIIQSSVVGLLMVVLVNLTSRERACLRLK